MSKNVGGWILIEAGDSYRKLARYALEDDGSLYLWFVRAGTVQECADADADRIGKPKTRKLSYHATGQVHLEHRRKDRVFMEPFSRVSALNLFAVYRVPSVGQLDIHDESPGSLDLMLACSDLSAPAQFFFGIGPCATNVPGASGIRFEGLFTLCVAMAPEASDYPEHLKRYFSLMLWQGLFDRLQMQEDQAFVEFYQKLNAWPGLMVFPPASPAAKGVYRVVPAVPMRGLPTLLVEFDDPLMVAHQSETKRENVDIRFRVSRKGSFLIDPVMIKSISLDAELY